VLRDITFINIGNSNYQPDGSINLDRLIMLYKQVKQVRKLQVLADTFPFVLCSIAAASLSPLGS